MKFIILVYCLFIGANSYSQSTKNSTIVLQKFFADKFPITYSDTIHQYDLKYLKQVLADDILYNSSLSGQKDNIRQLILTKNEKKYLLKKVDEQQGFVWPDNLFQNVRKDSSDKKNLTSNFKKFFQPIYNFSKPIFIRNDSICIFYYGYYCGGECGQGSVEIYHKIDGKWTNWISMIQWIS